MPKRAATVRKKSGYRFCSVIVFCDFRVWGEPPPFYCKTVCGESRKGQTKTAPRDRTTVRLFNLILAGVSGVALTRPADAVTRPAEAVTRRGDVFGGARIKATFSIFFWLEVANFDVFLFLVLHVCYLSFVGLVVCVVVHRTAIDARP